MIMQSVNPSPDSRCHYPDNLSRYRDVRFKCKVHKAVMWLNLIQIHEMFMCKQNLVVPRAHTQTHTCCSWRTHDPHISRPNKKCHLTGSLCLNLHHNDKLEKLPVSSMITEPLRHRPGSEPVATHSRIQVKTLKFKTIFSERLADRSVVSTQLIFD